MPAHRPFSGVKGGPSTADVNGAMRITVRIGPRALAALSAVLLTAITPTSASAAPSVSGVTYSVPDSVPLLLDVYEPSGGGPFPAIVLVHGGGWKSGSRTVVADEAATLARAGFVVFDIDYRLACKAEC